jgi:hypothetical protein
MQAIQSTRSVDARLASRAIGAMFFSVFGAILLEVWDRRAAAGKAVFVLIVLLGAALAGSAWLRYRRHAPALALEAETPERKRAASVFRYVNAGQWGLILVIGNVLANLGLGAWVVPMAIGVIGLHFVPLAHVFRYPPHYLTAAALVGFAILYPRWAPGGPADPVGFLGTGLILWASALWGLRRP